MRSRPSSSRPRSHITSASRASTRAAGCVAPCGLEQLDRLLEVSRRVARPPAGPGQHAGPLVELGLHEGVVGQLDGPLERPLRLARRAERRGTFAGPDEQVAGGVPDLAGIVGRRALPGSASR